MPNVNEGKLTDVSQLVAQQQPKSFGLIERITGATRYLITGVSPATWFGPMQPLQPMAPEDVKGRRFDYQTGFNLNYVPRSDTEFSFGDLRSLADNCDLLRIVIEARKEQIAGGEWVIRPRQSDLYNTLQWRLPRETIRGSQRNATPDQQERISVISEFLEFPDKENDWDQWQRQMLEDMFVIDAPCVYRRPTRGGKLYALDILDGATIKPLLDDTGRRPEAPDPAYQQVLHGVPAADYTRDELYYFMRNPRSNRVYGYPPVEQILMTANTAIRRALNQLEYYTTGSQPDAFIGLPEAWSIKEIKEFQVWLDSMLSGKSAERRKLRAVPGNFKYQETKTAPLKDLYDEWLARVICFAFAISPEPFIDRVTRGSAQTSRDRSMEEGREPLQRWMKNCMDRILRLDFASPDLEFVYVDDREQDPEKQVAIDVAYVEAGIRSINEARALRGQAVRPGVADELMIKTTQGYVPVGKLAPSGRQSLESTTQEAESLSAQDAQEAPGTEDITSPPPPPVSTDGEL